MDKEKFIFMFRSFMTPFNLNLSPYCNEITYEIYKIIKKRNNKLSVQELVRFITTQRDTYVHPLQIIYCFRYCISSDEKKTLIEMFKEQLLDDFYSQKIFRYPKFCINDALYFVQTLLPNYASLTSNHDNQSL